MKLYLSIKSIPELADLSKQNRKKVYRRTRLIHLFKVGFLPALICGFFIGVGCLFGQIYYGFWGGFFGIVIVGGIGGAIAWEIEVNLIRPYLREYLKSHEKI